MLGNIVLLIGIADGVMPSAQFEYLYHLPLSKKLGFSKTLGIEGFFSSLIGAAAPVVFSVLMMYGNGGLVVVALVVCICAILFAAINKSKKTLAGKISLLLICCLITSLFSVNVSAQKNKEKLVIGYCQAESYYEFDYQLFYILAGMQENGDIMADMEGLQEGSEASKIWQVLAEAESENYVFPLEGFIDFSTEAYLSLSEEEIAARINEITY